MVKTMNRLALVMLVGMVGVWLGGCSSGPSASDLATANNQPAQPVPILDRSHGSSASLSAPMVKLITSKAELAKLGIKPESSGKLNVNFAKNDLILLALGKKSTTGYWAQITGVQQVGKKLYVQGLANEPAPNQHVSKRASYPYSLVMIPKTGATELASDIQPVTGQPMPK